ALAEQAVVDEDALELRADRLVQQQRDHRAVHAAGKRADHALPADLFADLLDRFLRERAHLEVEGDAAVLEERLVQLAPPRGMRDFGVELQGMELPLRVADGRIGRVVRLRQRADALGPEGADLLERYRAGMELAIDVQLADPAGDQLRVLRPEVEDQDLFCMDVGHPALQEAAQCSGKPAGGATSYGAIRTGSS